MMNVDVNVEDSGMDSQQLKDAKNTKESAQLAWADSHIVHVTETRSLGLLRMVEATGPVDRDIGVARVQLLGGTE